MRAAPGGDQLVISFTQQPRPSMVNRTAEEKAPHDFGNIEDFNTAMHFHSRGLALYRSPEISYAH